ncbi:MAG: alpha/beta hydrolase [Undibacterium sp.]|uniref:PGAP1-like alpha/beta domain-containing protein n=1 Tax=Undibacterium sp. TaxID=1914977 RepID=UPI0027249545|nr:alpha/beta hydrolase [Undibacterium sp.]MDO8650612.1 alpha/beta hydrolase [Undibacterium sp.]
MSKDHSHSSDLRGLSRLTIDAIVGLVEMVEAVNMNILKSTVRWGVPVHKPLSSAVSMLYGNIRAITSLVGSGIDTLLNWLTPLLAKNSGWPGREPVLAVLNGVLGDYLEQTHNPLSITMAFRYRGQTLTLEKQALTKAMPHLNGRILVLAHGLCMNDLGWRRRRHDHGAALAHDRGYTPVYLYYNSGRHISTNGREFAEQLEVLVQEWPVAIEELVILGHSMGGMIARSAFHYGTLSRQRWPRQLRKLVFLGTPHHGAPLERGGNWFHVIVDNSSYTAPLSSLGKIRSAGITDLRYGNILDQDWEGFDRFAHVGDQRIAVPLPLKVQCYAIAATTGKQAGDIRDRLLGDGLVPLESALGQHEDPSMSLVFAPENQRIEYGMNHLDLLSRDAVYKQLLEWL